jgi:hypothetical protein
LNPIGYQLLDGFCFRFSLRFQINSYFCSPKEGVHLIYAGIAQLVEHDLAKVGVASSSLVSRSKGLMHITSDLFLFNAPVVELVDTQDLKSCVFTDVRVQVPSGVHVRKDKHSLSFSVFIN